MQHGFVLFGIYYKIKSKLWKLENTATQVHLLIFFMNALIFDFMSKLYFITVLVLDFFTGLCTWSFDYLMVSFLFLKTKEKILEYNTLKTHVHIRLHPDGHAMSHIFFISFLSPVWFNQRSIKSGVLKLFGQMARTLFQVIPWMNISSKICTFHKTSMYS